MITLQINDKYIPDLHDDVFGNYKLKLYQFLENDPVRAFYFGACIKKWFSELNQERQLLYSKELRHSSDNLEKYKEQIKFWTEKFSDEEEVNMIEFSEYLLNNMFYDDESDIINLALFLGGKTDVQDENL